MPVTEDRVVPERGDIVIVEGVDNCPNMMVESTQHYPQLWVFWFDQERHMHRVQIPSDLLSVVKKASR